MYGYHSRYLLIDLSTRSRSVHALSEDVLRETIGGVGLGTRLLHAHSTDHQEPLGPDSPLIFVFSPLVGSPLTTSAKFAVVGQSPLTNRINDSLSSSHFAIAGKKTGYDAIVIVGSAASPTCVVIEPDRVRFEAANDEWGMSSRQAGASLQKKLGAGFRIASIGPAGENLVRFATVSHEGRHAGRGGMGAVMGAKKLKAIAVRGDRITPYAHHERLTAYSRELSKKSFGPATAKYRELGTLGNLLTFNRLGTLPTRNFQTGTLAGLEGFATEALAESFGHVRNSCAACTIGCEHLFQLPGKQNVRMEYENLFALGPLCGITDPEMVLAASQLCDDLGMDTISAGATVAFAMECAEKGILPLDELRFGSGEALKAMLNDISARNGWGDLLANGTRFASQELGQGSEDFAPHVKGLEIPGYEPRALQAMALGFAVGSRGADHNRSGAYQIDFSEEVDRMHASEESVRGAIETENEAAVMDSLILCKFLRGVFDDRMASMAEMLELITGWDVTAEELKKTAERIVRAKKLYNIRQGWTPAEDTLPKRFLSEALPEGASQGASLSSEALQRLIRQYNLLRGWTAEGYLPEMTADNREST
ncbi:MAG: aldehyde ferredoxin oxidoreductase family protein [Planctomycetaceae bacterium]